MKLPPIDEPPGPPCSHMIRVHLKVRVRVRVRVRVGVRPCSHMIIGELRGGVSCASTNQ